MQDVHIDIAMFAIYAMHDKTSIDKLMNLFFTKRYDRRLKKKIYAYIAICGLLWSNWCEYKRILFYLERRSRGEMREGNTIIMAAGMGICLYASFR